VSRTNTTFTDSSSFPAQQENRIDETFILNCLSPGAITLSGQPSTAVCPKDDGLTIKISSTTGGNTRDVDLQRSWLEQNAFGIPLAISDDDGNTVIIKAAALSSASPS
jgi:hypothetical protein